MVYKWVITKGRNPEHQDYCSVPSLHGRTVDASDTKRLSRFYRKLHRADVQLEVCLLRKATGYHVTSAVCKHDSTARHILLFNDAVNC